MPRVVAQTGPHHGSCRRGLCGLPAPAGTPLCKLTGFTSWSRRSVPPSLLSAVNALPFLPSLFASLFFTLSSIFSFPLPPRHFPAASCAAPGRPCPRTQFLRGHGSLQPQIKRDQPPAMKSPGPRAREGRTRVTEGRQEATLGMRFLSRTNSSWRGKEIYSFLQINTTRCGRGRWKEETLISTHSPAVSTCAFVWEHKQPRSRTARSPALTSLLQLCPAQAVKTQTLYPHHLPHTPLLFFLFSFFAQGKVSSAELTPRAQRRRMLLPDPAAEAGRATGNCWCPVSAPRSCEHLHNVKPLPRNNAVSRASPFKCCRKHEGASSPLLSPEGEETACLGSDLDNSTAHPAPNREITAEHRAQAPPFAASNPKLRNS